MQKAFEDRYDLDPYLNSMQLIAFVLLWNAQVARNF